MLLFYIKSSFRSHDSMTTPPLSVLSSLNGWEQDSIIKLCHGKRRTKFRKSLVRSPALCYSSFCNFTIIGNHSFFLIKGALYSLRQFLGTESPLKIMEDAFYFILKALFALTIAWHLLYVTQVSAVWLSLVIKRFFSMGTLYDLRQFLAIKSPLKIMENALHFILKALFILNSLIKNIRLSLKCMTSRPG